MSYRCVTIFFTIMLSLHSYSQAAAPKPTQQQQGYLGWLGLGNACLSACSGLFIFKAYRDRNIHHNSFTQNEKVNEESKKYLQDIKSQLKQQFPKAPTEKNSICAMEQAAIKDAKASKTWENLLQFEQEESKKYYKLSLLSNWFYRDARKKSEHAAVGKLLYDIDENSTSKRVNLDLIRRARLLEEHIKIMEIKPEVEVLESSIEQFEQQQAMYTNRIKKGLRVFEVSSLLTCLFCGANLK